MATIDPNIAMGYRPIQIENPLNQLAAMTQIQAGQQGQQLNALKIQEAQQELEDRNALRGIPGGINDPDYISNVAKINPKLAIALQKDLATYKKSGLEATELQNKITAQDMEQQREGIKHLVSDPSDPTVLSYLNKAVSNGKLTPEAAKQQWTTISAMPLEKRVPYFTMLGTKAEEFFKQQAPTPEFRNFQLGQANPAFAARQIELKRAGSTQVNLPTQEKEFEKELGGGQAKIILKSKEGALDAASILQTNEVGRNLLKSGAITGAGADFFVGLNQALKTAGIDAGYADASANSQAYAAAMGQNTAKLIKQFGAGTGLSNADRDYAEKIVAGKITMDEKAIRKILDINDTASRNVIKLHNKSVEGIKTNVPLKVDLPRGEPVKTGKVTSGPNAGKTVIEYADGTREYQ